jgi:hypothetical protein
MARVPDTQLVLSYFQKPPVIASIQLARGLLCLLLFIPAVARPETLPLRQGVRLYFTAYKASGIQGAASLVPR